MTIKSEPFYLLTTLPFADCHASIYQLQCLHKACSSSSLTFPNWLRDKGKMGGKTGEMRMLRLRTAWGWARVCVWVLHMFWLFLLPAGCALFERNSTQLHSGCVSTKHAMPWFVCKCADVPRAGWCVLVYSLIHMLCMCVCVCTYIYYLCVCVCVCMCVLCICVCACTCIYIYMYRRIETSAMCCGLKCWSLSIESPCY
jgi:hypothetical protein